MVEQEEIQVVPPHIDYTVPENQSGLLSPDYLASTWCFWRYNVFSYWLSVLLAKMGVLGYILVEEEQRPSIRALQYGTLSPNINRRHHRATNRHSLFKNVIQTWGVKGSALMYNAKMNSEGIIIAPSDLDAEFHVLTIPKPAEHQQTVKYLRDLYLYDNGGLPYDRTGGWIVDIHPVTYDRAYVLLFNRGIGHTDELMAEELYNMWLNLSHLRMKQGMRWPRFPSRIDLPIAVASLITSRFINHFMFEKDLPESVRQLRNINEDSMNRIDPLPSKQDCHIELWGIDVTKQQIERKTLLTKGADIPAELVKPKFGARPIAHIQPLVNAHKNISRYWKATFFGTGHLGSWIALMLGMAQMKQITLIDYDRIEHRNIAGAGYRFEDQGRYKTDQLGLLIEDMIRTPVYANPKQSATILHGADPDVQIIKKKLTQRTMRNTLKPIENSNFYIISTDSWNSRHDFAILLKRLRREKSIPSDKCWVIDCRSLERLGQIIIVNLNDKEAFQKYFQPLEESSIDRTVLPCDRANVIDLPLHLARVIFSLIWNEILSGDVLPRSNEGKYHEYYINAYNYKVERIT